MIPYLSDSGPGAYSSEIENRALFFLALANEDATVILLCWPRRIRPLIRGVSRGEIEAAFTGWQVTDVEQSFFKLPPPLEWVLRPDEHWYRLRRS